MFVRWLTLLYVVVAGYADVVYLGGRTYDVIEDSRRATKYGEYLLATGNGETHMFKKFVEQERDAQRHCAAEKHIYYLLHKCDHITQVDSADPICEASPVVKHGTHPTLRFKRKYAIGTLNDAMRRLKDWRRGPNFWKKMWHRIRHPRTSTSVHVMETQGDHAAPFRKVEPQEARACVALTLLRGVAQGLANVHDYAERCPPYALKRRPTEKERLLKLANVVTGTPQPVNLEDLKWKAEEHLKETPVQTFNRMTHEDVRGVNVFVDVEQASMEHDPTQWFADLGDFSNAWAGWADKTLEGDYMAQAVVGTEAYIGPEGPLNGPIWSKDIFAFGKMIELDVIAVLGSYETFEASGICGATLTGIQTLAQHRTPKKRPRGSKIVHFVDRATDQTKDVRYCVVVKNVIIESTSKTRTDTVGFCENSLNAPAYLSTCGDSATLKTFVETHILRTAYAKVSAGGIFVGADPTMCLSEIANVRIEHRAEEHKHALHVGDVSFVFDASTACVENCPEGDPETTKKLFDRVRDVIKKPAQTRKQIQSPLPTVLRPTRKTHYEEGGAFYKYS